MLQELLQPRQPHRGNIDALDKGRFERKLERMIICWTDFKEILCIPFLVSGKDVEMKRGSFVELTGSVMGVCLWPRNAWSIRSVKAGRGSLKHVIYVVP